MRIKVTRIWQQGYSRRIALGEYEIDDPRLLSKGQYLVDNGFAEIIEQEKPKVEPKVELEQDTRPKRKKRNARKVTNADDN